MLAYRKKNRDGSIYYEKHLNPKYVAVVTCKNTGPNIYEYQAETVGGGIWEIDMRTYNRIAAWMERNDG